MPTIGAKALRKAQIGLESTAGTQVAATNILIGEGTLQDTREIVFQKGDVGSFLGNQNTRTAKYGGELAFEQEATFEQLPYVLNASISSGTIAQDGAGSGYIYTYSLAATAPTTINTYSIEGGDNITTDVEVMVYSYIPEFTLSGKGGEPIMVNSTWRGRSVSISSDDGFTAGVAVPTVEAILFSRGTLNIDDSTDTIGTTTVDSTLLSFELKVNSGWKEVWTADGLTTPTFAFIKQTAPDVTCDITFEHDANSANEKADWRLEYAKRIRLTFLGSGNTTTGTAWSNKALRVDMYGKWLSFDKIDEMDGNDIVKGTFKVLYDSTGTSLSMDVTVVNELSALI